MIQQSNLRNRSHKNRTFHGLLYLLLSPLFSPAHLTWFAVSFQASWTLTPKFSSNSIILWPTEPVPGTGRWSWSLAQLCPVHPAVLSGQWSQGHQWSQHLLRVPWATDNVQDPNDTWQSLLHPGHPAGNCGHTARRWGWHPGEYHQRTSRAHGEGSHDFFSVGRKRIHS